MKRTLRILMAAAAAITAASCCGNCYDQVATTETSYWQQGRAKVAKDAKQLTYDIAIDQKDQEVGGFGACFNELGWTSLSLLTEAERATIIKELFAPNTGANFNVCRMPVAANDFSTDWYSYNETDGDFAMENFSIEHDKATLIPFIKSALKENPEIKIWGSPWCPPSWMKVNNHYACNTKDETTDPAYHNGLPKNKRGRQGQDMFIQKPEYLDAYALYFEKYIKAYKEEGVDIYAVMPQNEFNSSQVFPSCIWKAATLGNFISEHLGPRMERLGVEVMFGTMERANAKMVDTVLMNKASSKYIKGVGFQWAGKGAIAQVHKDYPEMPLMQTEQECGDGKNDWKGTDYSWSLLKHYFDSGVSTYLYWNISLLEGGISRWGWAQNSLVVVDPTTKSYRFTPEYYLMKHISHYVKQGARYIKSPAGFEGMVFENPNGEIVVLYMEREGRDTKLQLNIDSKSYDVAAKANSINTYIL